MAEQYSLARIQAGVAHDLLKEESAIERGQELFEEGTQPEHSPVYKLANVQSRIRRDRERDDRTIKMGQALSLIDALIVNNELDVAGKREQITSQVEEGTRSIPPKVLRGGGLAIELFVSGEYVSNTEAPYTFIKKGTVTAITKREFPETSVIISTDVLTIDGSTLPSLQALESGHEHLHMMKFYNERDNNSLK